MKLADSIAIMQPYVFPYIGYFQLIYASEIFVFYDDVSYINKGWINRNRVLLNGKDHMITVPCQNASQNRLIKDIKLADDDKAIKKLLMTISAAYSKAPEYSSTFPIIENIFHSGCDTISELAITSTRQVCRYLGIASEFKTSSESYSGNIELKKADRLIDICNKEKKKNYINPEGGRAIYTKEYYAERGINLHFLIPQKKDYNQFGAEFVPWLSIIDVLMFNKPQTIVEALLPAYTLD
ncbi:MAG: WbqC family protein [Taibaiella sp.]|nr:WbqC family protein [Taibaiella sp.]